MDKDNMCKMHKHFGQKPFNKLEYTFRLFGIQSLYKINHNHKSIP